MRRFTLPLAAVCALAFVGAADAQYIYNPYNPHRQYHNDLQYRKLQRQQFSNYAHQFPMTPSQHQRLHQELDREDYRDHLEHREFHHQNDPRRYSYRNDQYDHGDDQYDHGYNQYSPGYQYTPGNQYSPGYQYTPSYQYAPGYQYNPGYHLNGGTYYRPRSGFTIVTPRFSFSIGR